MLALMQFSNCRGLRLMLISVPSHQIAPVVRIILSKPEYIHHDGNLTCKRKGFTGSSWTSTTPCAVLAILTLFIPLCKWGK